MIRSDAKTICGCCGAKTRRRVLGAADSRLEAVATSDAAYLRDVRVERTLCMNCGALEVVYDPKEALATHFAQQYDVGAAVQNNLVVRDGAVARKKTLIDAKLESWIARRECDIADVLEIACGQGELISRLAEEHQNWICTGIDPTPDLLTCDTPRAGLPRLIQGFFSPDQFTGENFDLVIAHGFLNRSPTVKELSAIRSLCRDGALVSFELLYLDTSPHCPAIWDHSYMFTRANFARWMEARGFRILEEQDNASSWHVLAEAAPARQPNLLTVENGIESTATLYESWSGWWAQAVARATAEMRAVRDQEPVYLFGAGMFTAALLAKAPGLSPEAILDDAKAGGRLAGVPVIAPEEADKRGRVLVFTRPAYMEAIAQKA